MHTFVSITLGRAARLIVPMAVMALAGAAQTPSLTTLYSFAGGASGANPTAGVVFGANGSLFGMTPYGGNYPGAGIACQNGNGCGTVFELTPGSTWSQKVLYSFQGGTDAADGANPGAALTSGANGVFYGTTFGGGSTGNGTVFQLSPPTTKGGAWTETVLYSFQAIASGSVNVNGTTVTLASGAPFVTGTTWNGLSITINGCAPTGGCTNGTYTIASVGSSSSLTLTTSTGTPQTGVNYWESSAAPGPWMGWPDGSGPEGGVVLLPSGKLYGTTSGGGAGGAGAVFELNPPAGGTGPWTETLIYSFQGGKDGSGPQTGLVAVKGDLYGTTCCGTQGGTVFRLAPTGGTWTEKPIYSFSKTSVGDGPFGGLAIDSKGVLYGTTKAGGTSGSGIVFSLTPPTTKGKPYTLTTIHNFTGGTDGGSPYGGLVRGTSGQIYATVTAGCAGGGGVVEFTPPTGGTGPWTETVLYSFTGATDGSEPYSGVILNNSLLYGTTNVDGVSGYGTVFELTP